MEAFIVYLDEFDGEDLVYLMEKFAARLEVERLKIYVTDIMINDLNEELKK